tara:strand:- start:709 stop:837 length:129 start_codon:yes stop_codon:yes gene_type:complete
MLNDFLDFVYRTAVLTAMGFGLFFIGGKILFFVLNYFSWMTQ